MSHYSFNTCVHFWFYFPPDFPYLLFLNISFRYVLTELIETETLYVEDLGLIVQVCLFKASDYLFMTVIKT